MSDTPTNPETARIPESEWAWFGVAGHFICGDKCQFHLTTRIGMMLVSTIGEYMPDSTVQTILARTRGFALTERGYAREAEFYQKNGGFEKIGAWGKYETMVFAAGAPCAEPDCDCGLPSIDGHSLGGERYDARKDATEGHMRYCELAATGRIPIEVGS